MHTDPAGPNATFKDTYSIAKSQLKEGTTPGTTGGELDRRCQLPLRHVDEFCLIDLSAHWQSG